ncbi:FAD-binding oxidoreductase [Flagellimonas sp. HMM57]|uniref:NAD(P)/FAD-dependent oxidoreductase n=1 Tax=unclassified Flagellimonas TaxID=2644544 RepID=UPI0013D3E87A|nr:MULTISPECIES: FAD-dependent oxidoreductase [unclassified Flagellimonas]UII77703.1 FAD-binding oxidoreductase [Flagellimonas sp. HMM57]
MGLSYWEHKTWFSKVDFTIVGSGIVGLNCALHLKEKYPKSEVLLLEKEPLPQGASTKNAGFACFGSISEILADLKTHTEQEVIDLVQKRWEGIQLLRQILGDRAIGFENNGGHELFLHKDVVLYEGCLHEMERLNKMLEPIFGAFPFLKNDNFFQFEKIKEHYITHQFEGQLDTGQMMSALLQKCQQKGVRILNGVEVETLEDVENTAVVKTKTFAFKTKKVFVATNGFSSKLLKNKGVAPARAQVLITKPIKNLKIKGTFHFDEGYYYFRNVDNRILFGGGRNLDFETEATASFGETPLVQNTLEKLLAEVILPNQSIEIDQRWSGIMGIGLQKNPILEQISNNIYCGIRLGGMGIALGSLVGKELADLVE